MFDITSSKLLILGIVALLVIGPKDLPALLRTIGKYMGIIKRQAAEFRAQFDEAMRESELQQLKKDVESMGQEAEATMRAAEQSVHSEIADASRSVDTALNPDTAPAAQIAADPMAHDANGLPLPDGTQGGTGDKPAAALNGTGHAAEASEPAPAPGTMAEAGGTGVKTGA
jgi:sec-independent protein translocase protein TatB